MFSSRVWSGHLVASCVLLASCATTRLNPAAAPLAKTGPVITAEELGNSTARTAYDAVVELRPLFLKTRGANSVLLPTVSLPDVSVGDQMTGDINTLRDILVVDILDIRLLDRWEAERRYGGKHDAGTILVRVRMGRS